MDNRNIIYTTHFILLSSFMYDGECIRISLFIPFVNTVFIYSVMYVMYTIFSIFSVTPKCFLSLLEVEVLGLLNNTTSTVNLKQNYISILKLII